VQNVQKNKPVTRNLKKEGEKKMNEYWSKIKDFLKRAFWPFKDEVVENE